MVNLDIPALTENLIQLQRKYAFTYRKMIPEERYKRLVESGLLKEYSQDSEAIREPLIEHIGHLPIIASYLHQHVEHSDQINLGRALIMLSIHDIGETEVGDMLAYAKTDAHQALELEAAKKILPDYLYAYFEEIEKRETIDGKFAKAVDSMAPILHEMTLPKVTLERFKHYHYNVDKIVAKKKVHFEWDAVLREMFNYLIDKYRQMES